METIKLQAIAGGQLDDDTVIRRVLAGEKELFEMLMRRYNQTLFRVIRSYLKERDDIKDVMQNTYLKAYHKLGQFQGASLFSTWLIRIGINEALLSLKTHQRENEFYATDAGDARIDRIPDKQMNAEKIIINTETQQLLEQAIDALPAKYRIVYMLKEVEGLSNQQVGESLGITDSNIKVRVHRAKGLLKERLLRMAAPGHVFTFGHAQCDAMVNAVMQKI